VRFFPARPEVWKEKAKSRPRSLSSIIWLSPRPLLGIVDLDDSSGVAGDYTARGHTFSYNGVRTDYAVVSDSQLARIAEHHHPSTQPTVLFNSDFAALGQALGVNRHAGVRKFVIVIHNEDGRRE